MSTKTKAPKPAPVTKPAAAPRKGRKGAPTPSPAAAPEAPPAATEAAAPALPVQASTAPSPFALALVEALQTEEPEPARIPAPAPPKVKAPKAKPVFFKRMAKATSSKDAHTPKKAPKGIGNYPWLGLWNARANIRGAVERLTKAAAIADEKGIGEIAQALALLQTGLAKLDAKPAKGGAA